MSEVHVTKRPFGWCGPENRHGHCRVQFLCTMGVHQGKVVRCGCSCHAEEGAA